MTSIATASPRTSEFRFVDASDEEIVAPSEWQICYLLLDSPFERLADCVARVNGRAMPLSVRMLGSEARVVARWDRAGPGWYDLEFGIAGEESHRRIRIDSSKIGPGAMTEMLVDLEERLPVTIAIALRDAGARIGFDLVEPHQQTLATEVARLRRALEGSGRLGLLKILRLLANDPHRMLTDVGEWVRYRDVRRPDAAGLVQAVWKANNFEDGKPKRVLDRRVEHTVDLYENRIVKAFTFEAERRLRRLSGVLSEVSVGGLVVEVNEMLSSLVAVRRSASFLEEVGPLRSAPSRATMVLLRRMEYRAAYEGFLEFRRNRSVHLDEPAMSEPLRNLPYLYQAWCTLQVVREVLEVGTELGWTVESQRLVTPGPAGIYLHVLKDNRPVLILRNADGRRLRLFPERSYSSGGVALRSVSFTQRPDIALELSVPTGHEIVLLDPKYKLVSEEAGEPGDGTPTKTDVDKMHAYRDAIRDAGSRHVVRHAATLYPGRSVSYGDDVSAIRAFPGDSSALSGRMRNLLVDWLS